MNLDPQGQIPFEGTILLPSQMAALPASRPEQRLLFALLEASWETLSKYVGRSSKRAQRLVKEDLEWVNSDQIAPFSFRFCCEHLDMDPEALRAGIHRALAPGYGQGTVLKDSRIWPGGIRGGPPRG